MEDEAPGEDDEAGSFSAGASSDMLVSEETASFSVVCLLRVPSAVSSAAFRLPCGARAQQQQQQQQQVLHILQYCCKTCKLIFGVLKIRCQGPDGFQV